MTERRGSFLPPQAAGAAPPPLPPGVRSAPLRPPPRDNSECLPPLPQSNMPLPPPPSDFFPPPPCESFPPPPPEDFVDSVPPPRPFESNFPPEAIPRASPLRLLQSQPNPVQAVHLHHLLHLPLLLFQWTLEAIPHLQVVHHLKHPAVAKGVEEHYFPRYRQGWTQKVSIYITILIYS